MSGVKKPAASKVNNVVGPERMRPKHIRADVEPTSCWGRRRREMAWWLAMAGEQSEGKGKALGLEKKMNKGKGKNKNSQPPADWPMMRIELFQTVRGRI